MVGELLADAIVAIESFLEAISEMPAAILESICSLTACWIKYSFDSDIDRESEALWMRSDCFTDKRVWELPLLRSGEFGRISGDPFAKLAVKDFDSGTAL